MDDYRQIENLIYRYAEHIDRGELEAVAELFREGEIVSSAPEARFAGYDEVLGLYRASCRIYPDTGTPKTRHLTTNVRITVADDGATARAHSYYSVLQATADLPLQPIIAGHYEDDFRRSGGGWQFARREMFVDLLGDCSAHLLYDLATR